MMPLNPAYEITLPSSTIANWPLLLNSVRLMFANTLRASPLRLRLTAQTACCCGIPAEALLREVPSMADLDSRNLVFLFSPVPQVISGCDGSSSTWAVACPALGHLYAANLASHSSPGSA